MKNKAIKKIICMLLCAIMVTATPLSALAVELNSVPVIYVGEMSDNAIYNNPNENGSSVAFDINSSEFVSGIASIVAGILITNFSEVQSGIEPVTKGIKSLMDPILCNPDGESADNVGVWQYDEPVSAYTEDSIYSADLQSFVNAASGYVGADEIFFFSYDWRLDPTASADDLKAFIDHVKAATGKQKVAILAVGYGGVIVNSYLYEYEEHAAKNISSTVLYNTSILGNALIGDFMKGRIARLASDNNSFFETIKEIQGTTRGEVFFTFIEEDILGIVDGVFENILGSGSIQSLLGNLATMLVTMILEAVDVHSTLGKSYNKFALNADSVIYNDFLREYLRNMPGLWALVPEKDFDEALDFLFEDEFMNTALAEKVYAYRYVLANTEETLITAKNNGINVCVVSNYGYQLVPVTISIHDVSDGIESVKYSSVGAVTTDNSTEKGHLSYCDNKNHFHTSPDSDINAQYCVLPESTWFIKDVSHGKMTIQPVATFLVWLLFGYSQRNVHENNNYTQYMTYSEYSNKLTPYLAPGDTAGGAVYGDVDYSGTVNAADARTVLRVSVGLENLNKETKIIADVDRDGKVSAADARLVLRYSVGLESKLPV